MTCKQCKNFQRCMDEAFSLEQVFDPNYDGEYGCLYFSVLTNADRIRAMSDEELAEVIAGLVCIGHCVVSCSCSECFLEKICGEDIGVVEVLDFLKQPVKDGEDDG